MQRQCLRNFISVWPDRTVTFGNAPDQATFRERLSLLGRNETPEVQEYEGYFSFGLKFALSAVEDVRTGMEGRTAQSATSMDAGFPQPQSQQPQSQQQQQSQQMRREGSESTSGASTPTSVGGATSAAGSRPWPFQHYFGNPEFADVIVRIGTEDIPAHKIMLASASSKLAQLCRSTEGRDLHPSGKEMLVIEDVPSDVFNLMLHWCYTGTVVIAWEEELSPLAFLQDHDIRASSTLFMGEQYEKFQITRRHEDAQKKITFCINAARIAHDYGMPALQEALDEHLLERVSSHQWRCFNRVQQLGQIYLNSHDRKDLELFIELLRTAHAIKMRKSWSFVRQLAIDEIEVLQEWHGGRLWCELPQQLRQDILDAERRIAADRILKLMPGDRSDGSPKPVLKEVLKYHPVARERYQREIADRTSKYTEQAKQLTKRSRTGNQSPESNDAAYSPQDGSIVSEEEIAHAEATGANAISVVRSLGQATPVDYKAVADACSNALGVLQPTLRAMCCMTVEVSSVSQLQEITRSLSTKADKLQRCLYRALGHIIRAEAREVCEAYLGQWLATHAQHVDSAISESELLRSTLPLQIETINVCNDSHFESAITRLVFPRTHAAIDAKFMSEQSFQNPFGGGSTMFPLSFPTPSMTQQPRIPAALSIAEALKDDLAASEMKYLVENTELFLRSLDGDAHARAVLMGSTPASPVHSITSAAIKDQPQVLYCSQTVHASPMTFP